MRTIFVILALYFQASEASDFSVLFISLLLLIISFVKRAHRQTPVRVLMERGHCAYKEVFSKAETGTTSVTNCIIFQMMNFHSFHLLPILQNLILNKFSLSEVISPSCSESVLRFSVYISTIWMKVNIKPKVLQLM